MHDLGFSFGLNDQTNTVARHSIVEVSGVGDHVCTFEKQACLEILPYIRSLGYLCLIF